MRELRQFVEVANRRSISRAAEHLHISQPALSRAIRQLESSFGVPLFLRTGSGVALSPYGTALYSRAVRALRALDEAQEEISLLQGSAKATIHIAAGDLWGLVVLPEVIKRFAETHDDVLARVDITDGPTRFEGLRNGLYDLVFGTAWADLEAAQTVEFEPLVRQGGYIYCDRQHPLATARHVEPAELLSYSWISHGFDDDVSARRPGWKARDYVVRADTMMHALMLMRGSRLLTAASSGFAEFFREFGIIGIATDETNRVLASGPTYAARVLEKPIVRDFLRLTRERVTELRLPNWELEETDPGWIRPPAPPSEPA